MAKALVGHVQERGELAGFDNGNHLVPLGWGDVVAGGVVATSMQNHHSAGCGSVQAGQHTLDVDAFGCCVVIGIGVHGETSGGKQGAVVFPTGVADQDLGTRVEFVQKISTNFQAASAANGLHRGHAVGRDGLGARAKHQAFDSTVISSNAVDGQVATRRGLGHHGVFGLLHTLQQGELAVVVEINTDTEVDFDGRGVGSELLVQAQDRVAGCHFDGGKQRHCQSLMEEGRSVGGRKNRPDWVRLGGCSDFNGLAFVPGQHRPRHDQPDC